MSIPTEIKGKEVRIQIHFSKDPLNLDSLDALMGNAVTKKTTLSAIESQWAERDAPDYLDYWKEHHCNRPVLLIPIETVGLFALCFRYLDGRPLAFKTYTALLGTEPLSGQLNKEGCSQYYSLSSEQLDHTVVIDFCEMINLDPQCPYPTHRQEIKLRDCQRENGKLIIQVIPPPIILQLDDPKQNTLSPDQIHYLKNNGNNALLFIHGYNTPFGHYGHYPESFHVSSLHGYSINFESYVLSFKPSAYIRTIAYDLCDPHELKAQFPKFCGTAAKCVYPETPEGNNGIDDSLHGIGAHKWFTYMEYNFNRAAGFDGKDYSKYTRIVGIHWPGCLETGLEFARAEPIAHESGIQLMNIIESLVNAGIEVNVVAHSLGNRVLLRAMHLLGEQYSKPMIKHAVLWQAAVPDLALHDTPKMITNKRLLPCYAKAHHSSDKITVLHSKKDDVLGMIYPITNVMNATPYEHFIGKTFSIHNDYEAQIQKAYPDDYRRELHRNAEQLLHEYQRRSPEERELFVDYLVETKPPECVKLLEVYMKSVERYCKIENLPFLDYGIAASQYYGDKGTVIPANPFNPMVEVPINGKIQAVELYAYVEERMQVIRKVIYTADRASRDQYSKRPALGYEGMFKDNFRQWLEDSQKLKVIDQLDYLTGHSHMKIPSKVLMEEVYKKHVINKEDAIEKFGKYFS